MPAQQPLDSRISRQARILEILWNTSTHRSATGICLISPETTAEMGRRADLIDVRDVAELTGPVGHIPGSKHIAVQEVGHLAHGRDPLRPIVVISSRGDRAGKVAQYLELLGLQRVAALDGGMAAWRSHGYAVSRVSEPAATPAAGSEPKPAVNKGDKLSVEDVQTHVGDVAAVRWRKLAAVLVSGKHACVDGRDEMGVIGTPGGDAGEFLLVLTAWEQLTGHVFDREQIERILLAYIDAFGRFYMHTDATAMNRYLKAMREHPQLGQRVPVYERAEDWRNFFRAPPQDLRHDLLELMLQPGHMGCGHLRLTLQNPDKYGTRPELLLDFLRVFHTLRWNGAHELEYVTLIGEHNEGAVLSVEVGQPLTPMTQIPLVSPAVGGQQAFIDHPQVADYMRKESLQFLLHQTDLLPNVPVGGLAALQAQVKKLADAQLTATLGALAKDLPVYRVRFEHHRCMQVEALGNV
jgi:rhodanese-related sulfurtransferase